MTYNEYIQNILNIRGRFNCGNEYHEQHHIDPRCCDGCNDEDNLIDLFAKEHYEAHKLLALENPDNDKLQHAWWMMCHCNKNGREYEVSAEEYEEAKKRVSTLMSGKNNPMKNLEVKEKSSQSHLGHVPSQETREKLSLALKGKNSGENNGMFGKETWNKGLSWSEDVKQKMSNSWDYDKHFTEEIKKKLSISTKASWTDDRKNYYSQKMSGENNPFRIVVYCPELNESFISMQEAHNKYGVCISSISNCINGKQKFAGKHPITGEKLTWVKLEK